MTVTQFLFFFLPLSPLFPTFLFFSIFLHGQTTLSVTQNLTFRRSPIDFQKYESATNSKRFLFFFVPSYPTCNVFYSFRVFPFGAKVRSMFSPPSLKREALCPFPPSIYGEGGRNIFLTSVNFFSPSQGICH